MDETDKTDKRSNGPELAPASRGQGRQRAAKRRRRDKPLPARGTRFRITGMTGKWPLPERREYEHGNGVDVGQFSSIEFYTRKDSVSTHLTP